METTTAYKRIKETERTQEKEQCMMNTCRKRSFFHIKTDDLSKKAGGKFFAEKTKKNKIPVDR